MSIRIQETLQVQITIRREDEGSASIGLPDLSRRGGLIPKPESDANTRTMRISMHLYCALGWLDPLPNLFDCRQG